MQDPSAERDPRHMRALSPRFRTRGITGTQISGGTITGKEQNAQLTGLNWVQEAEEMLRTDPIVRRSWHMLRQTLLSASWRFIPGIENDPVAEELARYANECWGFDGYAGQMSISWEDQLAYLFEFVPLGYRYAEEIYKVCPDSEGKVRVWLSHYADREPSAHQKWLSRDAQQLDGVIQNTVGITYTPEPIPANKLLLLTLNKTGSNFEGVGMLRPVWWWWRTKQRDICRAQAFVSAEQSYLVENPAVKFETYVATPNVYADGPINIITKCDSQIAAAFLSQFADLGNTETGARSVGEIHHMVFRRAAINLCDVIASAVSGVDRRGAGTIGRLIRWNYGAVDPSKLPKLTHSGLDTDELAESLGALPGLVQAGLITPDDELERAIRDRLGAGDLPEEAERSPLSRVSTVGGGGGVSALTEQLIRRRRDGKA